MTVSRERCGESGLRGKFLISSSVQRITLKKWTINWSLMPWINKLIWKREPAPSSWDYVLEESDVIKMISSWKKTALFSGPRKVSTSSHTVYERDCVELHLSLNDIMLIFNMGGGSEIHLDLLLAPGPDDSPQTWKMKLILPRHSAPITGLLGWCERQSGHGWHDQIMTNLSCWTVSWRKRKKGSRSSLKWGLYQK